MKISFIFFRILLFKLIFLISLSSFSQFEPPENFYVTPVGAATWDSIQSDNFQFYKLFLDGTFVVNTDSVGYQYGSNGEELIAGESYLAEIVALYNDGLSEEVGFEFVYLPCDSFLNYNLMDAYNLEGSDDIVVLWSDILPMELIEINQGYGDPEGRLYQSFGFGYGVSYDLTPYPDALVHAVDFRHSSWDIYGTWDYMIHIVNRDDNTFIASVGPFQTTDDDTWEEMVELGNVSINGASEVAILMEPMGNTNNDAYPCISTDNADNPQGSISGELTDLDAFVPSTNGNFLMDIHIYTANHGKSEDEHIGTNIYLDDELLSFVSVPDTFFIIEDFPIGFHDICVNKVYSYDNGDHSWTSCLGEVCIHEVGYSPELFPPRNLQVVDNTHFQNPTICWLEWDEPSGFNPVWLQYDDGINIEALGVQNNFSYASKWNPDQLTGFEGTQISKISFFPRLSESVFVFKIWFGENASNLVYEQELSDINYDTWNQIDLISPVEIDPNQQLWIGFEVISQENPAGAGNYTGNSNSDLILIDGENWEHLSDYGLNYSWNLAAFIEASKGNNKSNELLGYIVYRDHEIVTDTIQSLSYIDTIHEYNYHACYQANAVYEWGISDPSNEACATIIPAITDIEKKFSVYPNPSQTYCKIKSSEIITRIKIYSQTGQLISSYENLNLSEYQLNFNNLGNGIYFLEIESYNNTHISKLIIQQ